MYKVTPQLRRVVTAGGPALRQVWLVGIQDAGTPAAGLALGEGAGRQEAADGPLAHAGACGKRGTREAMGTQGDHVVVAGQAPGVVLRAGGRPAGHRQGGPGPAWLRRGLSLYLGYGVGGRGGLAHPPHGGAVTLQEIRQRLTQRGQQMEAIHHLERLGCPLAGPVGVDLRAVTTEHDDLGMLAQPGRAGRGRPIRQQIQDPVGLQIHQDRRVGPPPTMREVVDAEDPDGTDGRERQRVDQAQQGRGTDRCALRRGVAGTGRAAHVDGVAPQVLVQTLGAPCPGRHQGGQPFGEDAAATRHDPAEEAAHMQMQRNHAPATGQVRQRAPVAAMQGGGVGVTQGAAAGGLRRRHVEVERVGLDDDRVDAQAGDPREEYLGEHRLSLQDAAYPSLSLSLSHSPLHQNGRRPRIGPKSDHGDRNPRRRSPHRG